MFIPETSLVSMILQFSESQCSCRYRATLIISTSAVGEVWSLPSFLNSWRQLHSLDLVMCHKYEGQVRETRTPIIPSRLSNTHIHTRAHTHTRARTNTRTRTHTQAHTYARTAHAHTQTCARAVASRMRK